jgi:hypothetical protein
MVTPVSPRSAPFNVKVFVFEQSRARFGPFLAERKCHSIKSTRRLHVRYKRQSASVCRHSQLIILSQHHTIYSNHVKLIICRG